MLIRHGTLMLVMLVIRVVVRTTPGLTLQASQKDRWVEEENVEHQVARLALPW